MEDSKKLILGIAITAGSIFMIVLFYILAGNYMAQYLLLNPGGNIFTYLLADIGLSTITGALLLVGSLFFFPLCIGGLLIYRGWKGEIK